MFILILLTALGAGLMAGVFFAFSTFVMRALERQPAAHGIAAMQAINVTVINPWFMTVFFGTAATGVAVAVSSLLAWDRPGAAWACAGGLLYVVGTFGVTIVFNVPRNNALARVSPDSTEGADLWRRYLVGWTAWNHVRTAAAVAAMAALMVSLWR